MLPTRKSLPSPELRKPENRRIAGGIVPAPGASSSSQGRAEGLPASSSAENAIAEVELADEDMLVEISYEPQCAEDWKKNFFYCAVDPSKAGERLSPTSAREKELVDKFSERFDPIMDYLSRLVLRSTSGKKVTTTLEKHLDNLSDLFDELMEIIRTTPWHINKDEEVQRLQKRIEKLKGEREQLEADLDEDRQEVDRLKADLRSPFPSADNWEDVFLTALCHSPEGGYGYVPPLSEVISEARERWKDEKEDLRYRCVQLEERLAFEKREVNRLTAELQRVPSYEVVDASTQVSPLLLENFSSSAELLGSGVRRRKRKRRKRRRQVSSSALIGRKRKM